MPLLPNPARCRALRLAEPYLGFHFRPRSGMATVHSSDSSCDESTTVTPTWRFRRGERGAVSGLQPPARVDIAPHRPLIDDHAPTHHPPRSSLAGDREAGVIDGKRGVANLGGGDEFRTPCDRLVEEARVLAMKQIDRSRIGSTVGGKQALRLSLVRAER